MSAPAPTAPSTADGTAPAPAAEPSPWLLAGCTGAAMLLCTVTLSAVFADWDWFAPTAIMVLAVVLAGALLRSVHVIRATGAAVLLQFALAAVLALYLTVPSAMPYGVPGLSAVSELFGLLGQGVDDVYATTAPADSTPGFTAVLVVGLGLITILVDGLVSDLRAPKASGILLLLVWVIPALLASPHLRWFHFAAVAAAFLILMLSRYLSSTVRRAAAYSLVAGALALVMGATLPLLLPPVAERPPQPLSQSQDISVVNPFLDLRSDLEESDDGPVLEYTTDDPLAPPLRLTSVAEFDGQTWMPEAFDIDPFAVAADGLPRPTGLAAGANVEQRTAQVSILDMDGQHLPAPYAPDSVSGLERRWIFDPKTLTIVGNGVLTTDAEYEVSYRSVEPSAADLAGASPVDPEEFETELSLPEGLPSVVAETAEAVSGDAANSWEAAVALQDFFRGGDFEYSLDAPAEASGDALADFLADRRGYCVQFSGAMTAMARSLGIPARIGVGFTAGTPTGDNAYSVSLQEAHAWPELYFEGSGWVRFEPTPGGPAGDPPPWTEAAGEGPEDTDPTASPTAEPTEDATEGAEETAPATEEGEDGTGDEDESAAGSGLSPDTVRTLLIVAAAALFLLLIAAPALMRLVQRRMRLTGRAAAAEAGTDLARAEGAWAELTALSIDFHTGWDHAQTLRAHEERLAEQVDEDARHTLALVTGALEASRYAGEAVPAGTAPAAGATSATAPGTRRGQRVPDAAVLGALVRALRSSLTEERGRLAAVRAALLPRSLWARLRR